MLGGFRAGRAVLQHGIGEAVGTGVPVVIDGLGEPCVLRDDPLRRRFFIEDAGAFFGGSERDDQQEAVVYNGGVVLVDLRPLQEIPERPAEKPVVSAVLSGTFEVLHNVREDRFKPGVVPGVKVVFPDMDAPEKAPGRDEALPGGGNLTAHEGKPPQRLGT